MQLDDLIPPHVVQAVASQGLHKVAGAMLGVPELGLDHALRALGERAYRRRKEAHAIVDGIAAFAVLTREKTADMISPQVMALLRRAAVPAAGGAALAYGASQMNQDPMGPHHSGIPAALLGALTGGAAGAGNALQGLPGGVGQDLTAALR
jgi:hypothetical protein